MHDEADDREREDAYRDGHDAGEGEFAREQADAGDQGCRCLVHA